MIPIVSVVMDLLGDKQKPVAAAASEAADDIFKGCDDNVTGLLVPELLRTLHSHQGNVYRLNKISDLCITCPQQVVVFLSELLAEVAPFIHDLKKEVGAAAESALKALCETCPNPDMEPFIPSLEKCLKDHSEIPETVFTMASTTFVAEVDAATLSIMAPILVRGLAVQSATHVKRQCARIIEYMSKLVDQPRFLNTFLPKILPLLDAAKNNISDPEAREFCDKAAVTLARKSSTAKPLTFDIVKSTEVTKAAIETFAPTYATKLSLRMRLTWWHTKLPCSMRSESSKMKSGKNHWVAH